MIPGYGCSRRPCGRFRGQDGKLRLSWSHHKPWCSGVVPVIPHPLGIFQNYLPCCRRRWLLGVFQGKVPSSGESTRCLMGRKVFPNVRSTRSRAVVCPADLAVFQYLQELVWARRGFRTYSRGIRWRMFCPGWGSRNETSRELRLGLANNIPEPAPCASAHDNRACGGRGQNACPGSEQVVQTSL